jgi:hypothetical protein
LTIDELIEKLETLLSQAKATRDAENASRQADVIDAVLLTDAIDVDDVENDAP